MSRPSVLMAVVVMLRSVGPLAAITWEFAADTQGWHARDGQCNIGVAPCAPLRGEVGDGVWRVQPIFDRDVAVMVELVSPLLGHPAELFDRLEIRFRVVHPDPFIGQLGLYWEAVPAAGAAGGGWWAQLYEPATLFTGDWQTMTVAAIPEHAMTSPGGWAGILQGIHIRMLLSEGPVPTVDGVPELVEIDRIRLTGTEELLSGELPPPDGSAGYYGTYFGTPAFYPLRRGAGQGASMDPGAGALADIDGDGRLDVLAGGGESGQGGAVGGWMYAVNDGNGGFGPVHAEVLGVAGLRGPDRVAAADLNLDGLADVVVMDTYTSAQVLYNSRDEGWRLGEVLTNHWYLGTGDMDGDGADDVWFRTGYPEPLGLEVLVASRGPDLRRETMVMQPPSTDAELTPCPRYLAGNLSGSLTTSMVANAPRYLWPEQTSVLDHAPYTGYRLIRWQEGGFEQELLGIAAHPGLVKSIGDLDQDGDLDFVLGNELLLGQAATSTQSRGLTLVLAQPDGSYRSLPWLNSPTPTTYMSVQELKWADLNGDGVLDVVFPDRAPSGPALMVCVGQKDGGVPVVEGRYELGGTPEEVLVGDIDGDGDQDLAVIESTYGNEGGGVEVFLNRMDQGTAVCESGHGALPAAPWLGASYPNPFNAGTVIPMTVPAGLGSVRVSVYDLVGQPVRRLVDGILSPGVHAVPWDGRDAQGRLVASGVYVCCLEAAGVRQSRRLVKLE